MQAVNKHKPFKNFIKWLKIILCIISIIFVVNNVNLFMAERSKNEDEKGLDYYEDFIYSGDKFPWYFEKGTIRPLPGEISAIWPEDDPSDRILNQLMFVPMEKPKVLKKIFLMKEISYLRNDYRARLGRHVYENCPVNNCVVTGNRNEADAVVFRNYIKDKRDHSVPPHQIWIVFALESPYHSGETVESNWTASYRLDSDIATPYSKWAYYNESVKRIRSRRNYAKGKKKKVAMVASNCSPENDRMKYALELKKYIDVDIYGSCGTKICPKNCFRIIGREYKFYLAFENSNCKEYITEKFFKNALGNNMLPIVMGAHPDDYAKLAPLNSYIHVDNFTSPKDLAKYLYRLDVDDDLYNSYFEWKGTGEFIELRFHCRLCALLHSNRTSRTFYNFQKWWNGTGICRRNSWTNNSEFVQNSH